MECHSISVRCTLSNASAVYLRLVAFDAQSNSAENGTRDLKQPFPITDGLSPTFPMKSKGTYLKQKKIYTTMYIYIVYIYTHIFIYIYIYIYIYFSLQT
jgi:hypothetical protein